MATYGLKYNHWEKTKYMKSSQTYHCTRKTEMVVKLKANIERSRIVKVTGHKNIQSFDDCDEANEDQERWLSYAISGRNNFKSTTDSIQRSSWPTRAACVFSSVSSTARSVNAIATDFNAQFISVWIKPKFHIAQSNMTRVLEQNLSNTFNYCQGFIHLKELQVFKTSHSTFEANKRRPVHMIRQSRFRLRLNGEF